MRTCTGALPGDPPHVPKAGAARPSVGAVTRGAAMIRPVEYSSGLASVHGKANVVLDQCRSFDASQPRERHRTSVARRAVDRLDHADVLQPFHAGRFRLAVVDDAIGEILEESGDGVHGLESQILAVALLD